MPQHIAKVLKLPVAKKGSWFHETYGVIDFSQADLDDFKRNFQQNARGYEPYARYGHSEKGPGLHGGEKALAHMIDVVQEDDVLYGLFAPKNETVVSEVENDEYRYISPEFVRCAYDRNTNARLGPLLLGVALTNSPSIPWLPRNVVVDADMVATLTDGSEAAAVLYELVEGAPVPDPNPVVEAPAAELPALTPAVEAPPAAELPVAETPDTLLDKLFSRLDGFSTKLESYFAGPVTPPAPEAPAPELAEEQPQPEEIAPPMPDPNPPVDTNELEELKAKLAAAETAREIAEAAKAAAEQEKAEAEEAARQIEADRKRETYVAMLTDRQTELVKAGVPPAAAQKAKDLALALAGTETVMLGDAPVNVVDAIFGLYSDLVGTIDFKQKGTTPPPPTAPAVAESSRNRIAQIKAQA